MAGLNFICSKGAAGPGEVTEEIDFVPYILSCSSWLASGWRGTVPCESEPGCISLSLGVEVHYSDVVLSHENMKAEDSM